MADDKKDDTQPKQETEEEGKAEKAAASDGGVEAPPAPAPEEVKPAPAAPAPEEVNLAPAVTVEVVQHTPKPMLTRPLSTASSNGPEGLPDSALDRRDSSKVRFSDVGDSDSSSDSSSSDEDTHLYAKPLPLGPSGQRGSIRRTSLAQIHPHHDKNEPAKLPSYHPRKRISMGYETFDYNQVESQRFLNEQLMTGAKSVQKLNMARWLVNFLVGLYVAVLAILVFVLIKYLAMGKFMAIYAIVSKCESVGCLIPGLIVWMLFNVFFVFVGAYMVTFHAPQAAGSGIPQVKCYLNGVRLPGLMSLRTLLAKAGGVVLSVVGGLCCGKEGPMIHSGAICASGLAKGRFTLGKKSCEPKCCAGLRSDEERRDFVAAGAASGVSAAFGSPVGGVLFALEEGASFVKQMLTWRMLFSSVVAGLFLNIFMSAINGHPGDMSSPGLVSFGYQEDIDYSTFEIPIFMMMALVGGLLGALFVAVNYKITLFRRRSVTKPWAKVGEAVLIGAISAIVMFTLIYAVPDCAPIPGFNATATNGDAHGDVNAEAHQLISSDSVAVPPAESGHHKRSVDSSAESAEESHGNSSHEVHDPYGDHGHGYVFRGLCPYGEENRMSKILFGTPEQGLHAMLHGDLEAWSMMPLFVMVAIYHLLTTWTYGINVSSGLFIPSLLIGAVWGRIVGMIVMQFIPAAGTNIAKYVLVGAACQLGGFVRMTISLAVIIIECTGDITFGIPIIISLIIAKWMGDFFNPGIYDLHIEIWGVPLLGWEPPEMSHAVPAHEVMSTPVQVLRTSETIGHLTKILDDEGSHNGFPIVDDYDPSTPSSTYGRLKGFILKVQVAELVKAREATEDDYEESIDLRMHMDRSPYAIQEEVSLPRIFKLFRGLGLRHLVVTNDRNRVVGIITRINVARFRGESVKGKFHVEELEVLEK